VASFFWFSLPLCTPKRVTQIEPLRCLDTDHLAEWRRSSLIHVQTAPSLVSVAESVTTAHLPELHATPPLLAPAVAAARGAIEVRSCAGARVVAHRSRAGEIQL
jgi:hypothetical protein